MEKNMNTLREELLQELPEFERKTKQFIQKEISMKEYKGYSGGFGSYAQRGGEAFMLRLRMNQGRITKEKLKLAIQKSLEKTQQLFDSLMQEYFG